MHSGAMYCGEPITSWLSSLCSFINRAMPKSISIGWPRWPDHDVGGFDIEVHHALLMGVFERIQQMNRRFPQT